MQATFRTRITELLSIRHPILLGGMHHLGESRMVAAMVNAGAMAEASRAASAFTQTFERAFSANSRAA
ncbi:hypothetical protein D9M68_62560 [compost metagenome]|jgi:NAD(P)H-dependent flavin oxidoreductase YrpB (nitropropane dioxygenase family)|uniref:hypothetical protein n=1 Tax=Cupriavidus necator TaxID=106590 RepID=UPI0028B3A03E